MSSPPDKPRRDRTAEILKAAFELLQEQPYAEITIENIAARAQVGKPTVYRRWPSKGALALDALIGHLPTVDFPDSGDVAQDLRQWLYNIADSLSGPFGPMITGLVGAAQHDPDLAQAWNERMFQPVRAAYRPHLSAVQDAGRLRQADPDVLADMLAGPIWFRVLMTGTVPDRERIDAIVEVATGFPAPRN